MKTVVVVVTLCAGLSVFGDTYPIAVDDIRIRDPYIVMDDGIYYLYESKPWNGGREVNVFESRDLRHWSEKKSVMTLPENVKNTAVWAPEVHRYRGRWYLFVTVSLKPGEWEISPMPTMGYRTGWLQPRGVWVCVSDSPRGPFTPVREESVTPREWMCLDGTFYEENGKPFMVFCHEWCQVGDGRMMLAELSEDLSMIVGVPRELFRASSVGKDYFVTDGPFLYRSARTGELFMTWSNKGDDGYAVYLKKSLTGSVVGPWQNAAKLFSTDGGHGMIFRDTSGQLRFALHQPNSSPNERMRLFSLEERDGGLSLIQEPDKNTSLEIVDPLIGTEGMGSEYGGMMPMTGVPFGSMHLVPVTRTNRVSATSFNALDRQLLGFILTRQPAIWMGEWGPVRIWLKSPLPIESVKASPFRTVVKAGGRRYELTADSHGAIIRCDDPSLGAGLPALGRITERTQRTSTRPLPNFACSYALQRCGDELRIAVSLIDTATAERTLKVELGDGFDCVAARTKSAWEMYFSRVRIEAPEDVKVIFYTALYHALLYPREVTEYGRYYSGMDDRVHSGTGYTCYSLWDTYRAEHPLLTLLAYDRIDGMMQSLVNMYHEGGWLPLWPNLGYTGQMVGGPAEVVLAEAYVKGYRGFDAIGAWEAVKKNATVPQVDDLARRWQGTLDDPLGPPETRAGLTRYQTIGYVAEDETNESVSRTLDYALDDASVAAFAAALGKHDAEALFRSRSRNYTNLWHAAHGCFLPRRSDGSWVDPKLSKNRPYTETDPQSARWCVPHDVEGLVRLMGGRDAFLRQLDDFFDRSFFRTDAVGNSSVHGNETCHHLAYMYNRVGEYEKTCRRVRTILEKCYSTSRRGFDGNEDCGQMSSWYIFSALGFYPLDPASGEYELGSPLVKSATLRFGAPYPTAELKIMVRNYAPGRWLVRRVTLNGRVLSNRRVKHADLVKGGELCFEMAADAELSGGRVRSSAGEVDGYCRLYVGECGRFGHDSFRNQTDVDVFFIK